MDPHHEPYVGKRRRSLSVAPDSSTTTSPAKRLRTKDPAFAALPAPLLQQVLHYELSLSDLASIARVSTHFNYLVSQARPQNATGTTQRPSTRRRPSRKTLGPITTESARNYMRDAWTAMNQSDDFVHFDQVWRAARSRMRSPIYPDLPAPSSERQLWSLLSQRTCQFCDKKPLQHGMTDPGDAYARIIWPFEMVSCGSCLLERVEPSSKTLQNPHAAIFVSILPHIRMIPTSPHEVSAIAPEGGPSAMKKYTLKEHLEQSRAKGAPGKADHDSKQRQTEEFMALAAQWERWDRDNPDRSYPRSPAPLEIRNPRPRAGFGSSLIRAVDEAEDAGDAGANQLEMPPTAPPEDRPDLSPKSKERHACISRRQAEIVKRCARLDPPIPLSILEHTGAYKATAHIPRDFTETDWAFLQPRLIQQRSVAEEHLRQLQSKSSAAGARTSTELTKDQIRQHFEALQKPTHDKLVSLFNDYVTTQANKGRNINNQSMSSFVLHGLVYVHRRFTHAKNAGQNLKLQELKWLLANKVAELYPGNDFKIFQCFLCGIPYAHTGAEPYSLDDLVQHHANSSHPLRKHANSSNRILLNSAPWDNNLFKVPPEPEDPAQTVANLQNPTTPGPTSGWNHAAQSYGYAPPQVGPSPHLQNSWSMPPPSPQYPGAGSPGAPSPFSQYGAHPGYPPPLIQPWASSPATPIQMQSSPFSNAPQSSRPNFQQVQQDVLADIAARTWHQLNPVKSMPLSVRCQAVIEQSVRLFKQRYINDPNIDVFVQAVMTHPSLEPLKHSHGVACKTCTEQEHKAPMLQTFFQLIVHFKDEHVQRASAIQQASTHGKPDELERLNWTRDMIWLAPRHEVLNTQKDYYMSQEIWELIRTGCSEYNLEPFVPPQPSGYGPPAQAATHMPNVHMAPPLPGPYHHSGPHQSQPVWVPPGAASPPPGVQWNGPASPPPMASGPGAYPHGYGPTPSPSHGHGYPHHAPPPFPIQNAPIPPQPQYQPPPSQQYPRDYPNQAYDVNQLAYRPTSDNGYRHDSAQGQHGEWRGHSNAASPVSNMSGTATASTVPSPQPGPNSSRPDIREILAQLNKHNQAGSTPASATSSGYPPANPPSGNPSPSSHGQTSRFQ